MTETLRVTRAELFKLVRRPAVWVLLATAAILNQIFAYVVPYLSYRDGGGDVIEGATPAELLASMMPDQIVMNTVGGFPVFAGALALVFGALMFGGEYGWGTIKTLLTQGPGRTVVFAGQALALALAVFAAVAVLFVLGALTSSGIALAEGQELTWPGGLDLAQGFLAGGLIMMTWAGLGAVLGVVLRSIALPIGLGVVWVLGVENLVSAMAGSVLSALEPVRDVLPGVNAGSLVSAVSSERLVAAPPGVTSSVDGTRALITLACYVVVGVAVALWASRRRDVV